MNNVRARSGCVDSRPTSSLPFSSSFSLSLVPLALALAVAGCSASSGNPSSSTGGTSQSSGGSQGTSSGGASGTGGATSGSGGASTASGGASAASGGNVGASGGATSSTGGSGNGSGGASGTSGSGGTTGGPGGSTGAAGSGGGASAGVFLTEDFESGTSGQQPKGWDNFIGYVKNGANPQGDTKALIDGTKAHGGKNSVHFHGTLAQLTRPLPASTNKLYFRAYFNISRQLGMNTDPGANHETLIGIRKTSGSASDEVRFGEIKGTLGTNEVPSDDISPTMDKWGKGPAIAANKWACVEVAFLADQPQHVLQAWADGVLVHSVTATDQWAHGSLPMDWMKGKFGEVIVGWQSFSSYTVDIWMDDLVLSTGPIGCN